MNSRIILFSFSGQFWCIDTDLNAVLNYLSYNIDNKGMAMRMRKAIRGLV